MKSYKDHRVLALNDFQDKDYEDVMKRPTFCPKEDHNKEELKYFCKTCEIPVCQICVTLDHGGHIMKLVKDWRGRNTEEWDEVVGWKAEMQFASEDENRQSTWSW